MATGFLYKLGDIIFTAAKVVPTSLQKDSEYRWAAIGRLNHRPSHQWIGIGMDDVTFEGTIYPTYTPYGDGRVIGCRRIDEMRTIAEQGLPLEFNDGLGNYFGRWVIKSISETKEELLDNGAPRRQRFTMKISRYGEDDIGERSILYRSSSGSGGVFSVPRIPTGNSPGANSPAVIAVA